MALSQYRPTPLPNQKQGITSRIPWWGWVAGIGAAVVVLLVLMKGSGSSTGVASGGQSSDQTQGLADLEAGLSSLLAQSGNSSSGGIGGGSAGDGLSSDNSVSQPFFQSPAIATSPAPVADVPTSGIGQPLNYAKSPDSPAAPISTTPTSSGNLHPYIAPVVTAPTPIVQAAISSLVNSAKISPAAAADVKTPATSTQTLAGQVILNTPTKPGTTAWNDIKGVTAANKTGSGGQGSWGPAITPLPTTVTKQASTGLTRGAV